MNDDKTEQINALQQQLNNIKSNAAQQLQQLNDLKTTVAQLKATIGKP